MIVFEGVFFQVGSENFELLFDLCIKLLFPFLNIL